MAHGQLVFMVNLLPAPHLLEMKSSSIFQFNGDDLTTTGGDGNMIHLRHVVSVETLGELVVSFKAWKGDTEEMEGHVKFNPEMSGRSCGYLKVGPCNVGVLVVWSRMRPVCEELMSDSQMQLCL